VVRVPAAEAKSRAPWAKGGVERGGADARRGRARKPRRSRRPPGRSAEDRPGGGAANLEEVREEKCGKEDGGARNGWDGEASRNPRECARAAASCKMQQLSRYSVPLICILQMQMLIQHLLETV
jgi:hypothetical protein